MLKISWDLEAYKKKKRKLFLFEQETSKDLGKKEMNELEKRFFLCFDTKWGLKWKIYYIIRSRSSLGEVNNLLMIT